MYLPVRKIKWTVRRLKFCFNSISLNIKLTRGIKLVSITSPAATLSDNIQTGRWCEKNDNSRLCNFTKWGKRTFFAESTFFKGWVERVEIYYFVTSQPTVTRDNVLYIHHPSGLRVSIRQMCVRGSARYRVTDWECDYFDVSIITSPVEEGGQSWCSPVWLSLHFALAPWDLHKHTDNCRVIKQTSSFEIC